MEEKSDLSLYKYFEESNILETEDGNLLRKDVKEQLASLMKDWLKHLQETKYAGKKLYGELLVFGSYALGVHTRGGDIDTVMVVSESVTAEDFFTSWWLVISQHSLTSAARKIDGTIAPYIQFTFHGVDVDMILSVVNRKGPVHVTPFDDTWLASLNQPSIKAVNGYREMKTVESLVPNLEAFRIAVIAAKLWAKSRLLYTEKLGGLAGVVISIMMCLVSQRNPQASAEELLARFFETFSTWAWPSPVMVRPLRANVLNVTTQWNPAVTRSDGLHPMPVITPAYPEQNAAFLVNRCTLHECTEHMKKAAITVREIVGGAGSWKDFFKPSSDFFHKYGTYLLVESCAVGRRNGLDWLGVVESRVRVLQEKLARETGIQVAHLLPRTFSSHDAESDQCKSYWFVGIRAEPGGGKLNLAAAVAEFMSRVKSHAQDQGFDSRDMTVEVRPVKKAQLVTFIPDNLKATFLFS